jgi:hypothetical protein
MQMMGGDVLNVKNAKFQENMGTHPFSPLYFGPHPKNL